MKSFKSLCEHSPRWPCEFLHNRDAPILFVCDDGRDQVCYGGSQGLLDNAHIDDFSQDVDFDPRVARAFVCLLCADSVCSNQMPWTI